MSVIKDKTLEEYVAAAYDALERATKKADEIGQSFYFSPDEGMGGVYRPSKTDIKTYEEAIKMLSYPKLDVYIRESLEEFLIKCRNDPKKRLDVKTGKIVGEEDQIPGFWEASSYSC